MLGQHMIAVVSQMVAKGMAEVRSTVNGLAVSITDFCAQAAMNIGGDGGGGGGRWSGAAGAGANPYLYGGMGGPVMGNYGELQQPAQQQFMLSGGVAYSTMDAMFGVGGQLAPGQQPPPSLLYVFETPSVEELQAT